MEKTIEDINKQITHVKNLLPPVGASDEQIKEYFNGQIEAVENIAKALGDLKSGTTTEVECLKDAVKSLKESLKGREAEDRVLTEKDAYKTMGKIVSAVWLNDRASLGCSKCAPNFGSDKWNNPSDFTWIEGKGFVKSKGDGSSLDNVVGNMATNDQYLINPVYSEWLIEKASEKSTMMPLVTDVNMKSPLMYLGEDEGSDISLTWATNYGKKIESVKVESPVRKELHAYTLSGYVSWYDEFDEDAYIDLGKRFSKKFSKAYALEFDRQCLTAKASPFTGALHIDGVKAHEIASADISKLTYEDFRKAEMLVDAEERKNCKWFLSDWILNEVTGIKDKEDRPLWRQPWQSMPGVIDGYETHVCSVMPQMASSSKQEPFAVFMNPAHIIHGNRKDIELKRFGETKDSLEYGQEFLRFRKRDAFLVTLPSTMAVLRTGSGSKS